MTLFEKLFPVRSSLRRMEAQMSGLGESLSALETELPRMAERIRVDFQVILDKLVAAEADDAEAVAAAGRINAVVDQMAAVDPIPDAPPVEPPPEPPVDETPPEPPADVVGEVTPGPDTFPGPQE